VTGEVRLEGVSFRYRRGRPEVLQEVDLHVAAGERVALVGPTGAGKSSILNLLPRFYDPTAGRVLLDGKDVREVRLASLRDQMALVFQEPVLFATTVAENIAYGRPGASREEIVEAARRAGIHEIIEGLSEGYDTVLGERGGTLSGGQRQGVAIARAMIKDAPVVLLDEPTVGLDRASTDLVVRALDRLMEGRTVILVSHDLSTLRDMDRLVVIENGRITGSGTHRSLLAESALYRAFHEVGAEESAS
jgi:ATP-binding cassette subfamily B protein/subfamily B ATP-binding cassette protein MsbA